jgi:hypothetical protein
MTVAAVIGLGLLLSFPVRAENLFYVPKMLATSGVWLVLLSAWPSLLVATVVRWIFCVRSVWAYVLMGVSNALLFISVFFDVWRFVAQETITFFYILSAGGAGGYVFAVVSNELDRRHFDRVYPK